MGLPAAVAILILLLAGPLWVRRIEENLEGYCLLLGILAIAFAGGANWELAAKALRDPIPISAAVIIAGILFRYGRKHFDRVVRWTADRFGRAVLAGATVAIAALLSSIITSIVAALMLVEALRSLGLPRTNLIRITVVGCLAIGLGASLTPLGEPLSTIAIDALELEFFGLFTVLAPYVLPGIIACAILAAFYARGDGAETHFSHAGVESFGAIALRGIKVFGFIAGLVLLGEAFAPIASDYINHLSAPALFWANVAGAALDNATVIAIEIHGMPLPLAREVILSLLVSGGMLIQGNIPNIIAAGALGISAASWARVGIPLGLLLLIAYFLSLRLA
ncbi:MAG: SLC13 family permease [Candidatus Binataceae bacterium]